MVSGLELYPVYTMKLARRAGSTSARRASSSSQLHRVNGVLLSYGPGSVYITRSNADDPAAVSMVANRQAAKDGCECWAVIIGRRQPVQRTTGPAVQHADIALTAPISHSRPSPRGGAGSMIIGRLHEFSDIDGRRCPANSLHRSSSA